MSTIKPTSEMDVEFATNQKTGEKVDHMCVITLGRTIDSLGQEKQQVLSQTVLKEINGVDAFQPVTRHAFELMIAKTFPADEVLAAVKAAIEIACSPIDLPAGGGGKLITGEFGGQ